MGSYPTWNRKFQKYSKKIKKKFENTIIGSFQDKISWKMPRKRENKKKINPISSYLTRNRKFQKKQHKNFKNQKTPSQLLFKPKQVGKGQERERKKKKSFQWVPTQPGIENSKNIAKKFENTIISSFQDKISQKMPRKREN